MSELDNLLDATLDDIADLPEFKNYTPGSHQVKASFAMDEFKDKPIIRLNFEYIAPIELADATAEAPKEGDQCSVMFMLDNEYGLGNFKKCAQPFAESLGFSTNREIVEGVKDVECAIITSLKQDKNDKDRTYLNVKEIIVA